MNQLNQWVLFGGSPQESLVGYWNFIHLHPICNWTLPLPTLPVTVFILPLDPIVDGYTPL